MFIDLNWKRTAETVWTAESDGRHVRVKQEGVAYRWTVYYPVEGSATGTAASVRAAKQAAIRAL